jgi:hypothetical protein
VFEAALLVGRRHAWAAIRWGSAFRSLSSLRPCTWRRSQSAARQDDQSAGHRASGRAPAASSLATGRNSFADRQGTPARCERSQPAGPRSRRRPRPPASNLQLEDYALTDPLAAVAAMRFSISRPRRGELARLTTPRDGGVEIALKNFSRSTLSVGRCNSTHGGASRAGNWRDALADRIRSRLT